MLKVDAPKSKFVELVALSQLAQSNFMLVVHNFGFSIEYLVFHITVTLVVVLNDSLTKDVDQSVSDACKSRGVFWIVVYQVS